MGFFTCDIRDMMNGGAGQARRMRAPAFFRHSAGWMMNGSRHFTAFDNCKFQEHHPEPEQEEEDTDVNGYRCPHETCGFTCATEHALLEHIATDHGAVEDDDTDLPLWRYCLPSCKGPAGPRDDGGDKGARVRPGGVGEVRILDLSRLPVLRGHGPEDVFKEERAASTVEAGKGWGVVGSGEGLAGAASRSLNLFRSVPRMAVASETNGGRGAVSAVIDDDEGEIARSIVRGRWELKRETKTAGLSPFVKSLAREIFTRHLSEGMPGEWVASALHLLLRPGLDDGVAACLQIAHHALSPLRLTAARPSTPTSRQPLS